MTNRTFHQTLGDLRKNKGISQRRAAADLQISQGLLSHYETGTREPGIPFLCRACDYYGVTADYLLGRAPEQEKSTACSTAPLRDAASQLRGLAEILETYGS